MKKFIKHHTDPPSTEIQTLNTAGPTKHDSWWTVLNVKGNDINYVWNIQGLHAPSGWKDLGVRNLSLCQIFSSFQINSSTESMK